MQKSRYLIGIDLGTTNCVLSYLDSHSVARGPQVLPVHQYDTPTSSIASHTLPSFNYLTSSVERQGGFFQAPAVPMLEGKWVPGLLARGRMAETPGRVIHSAKSWLCHGGIDRTAAILPWHSEEIAPQERLSPVQASAAYLAFLKESWNRAMAAGDRDAAFEKQGIIITVPASFDEAAQQLTLEAAQLAGYPDGISLIEEPQAAFYDWLGRSGNVSALADLLERVSGRSAQVLVCDIGGGTTDLSLFEVGQDPGAPSGLSLRRVAVSEHLLLGGDNIDLTLAYLLEHKLTAGATKLSGGQWNQLLVQARDLKERVLREGGEGDEASTTFTVTLAGTGAALFASTLSATITAREVRDTVLEGFFPSCGSEERPLKKGGGLREWGLPYAEDTAVTRHLAAFLDGRGIDAVLYNGGTMTPSFLRRRLSDLLARWQDGRAPMMLANDAMALAVARGAARYGHILREPQTGQRITGGHAHALYLEVVRGKDKKARSLVCVLPKGMEANESVAIDAEFDLLVNQPVRFQCFFSNRRLHDPPGALVPWREEEFRPLPPLQTAIHLPPDRPKPANNRLRVNLQSTLNELGLLQLFCVERDGPGRWRLDFNLRRPIGEEEAEPAVQESQPQQPKPQVAAAEALIHSLYGKKKDPDLPEAKPKALMRQLEQTLGGSRENWDSVTLRALWPAIAQGMTRRNRSVEHEEAWLYLAGFVLRPGYGFPLDDSRIEELWRLFDLGMAFPKEKRVQVQWYLLWRRAAGGLNARRQERVLEKIQGMLPSAPDTQEVIYLAGSLERLPLELKTQVVKTFASALRKPQVSNKTPYAWALGRLLARVPLYAGPETVVPVSEVEKLFRQVRELNWKEPAYAALNPLFAQAARRTERRDVDVTPELRQEMLQKMKESAARPEELQVVRELVAVKDADRVRQFGESLPGGLVLVRE